MKSAFADRKGETSYRGYVGMYLLMYSFTDNRRVVVKKPKQFQITEENNLYSFMSSIRQR